MNYLFERKFNKMKDILSSYDLYKGGLTSDLEKFIFKLKDKLSEKDYSGLLDAYKKYRDYVVRIFSNSKLIFVHLNEKIPTIELDEHIFEDLDGQINN